MKSQKGSVTVVALIMMLFLLILSGAWLIMMTQEKTNAYADEKQQQAWYAAEAGYKRAAMLINSDNSDWDNVKTTVANIKSNKAENFTKIAMNLGEVSNQGPWYAFSISVGDNDLSGLAAGGTSYTITSVGQYMGERKVISRTYVKKAGGGSSDNPDNPNDPDNPNKPVTPVQNGYATAAGSIVVNGSWNNFNYQSSSGNAFVSRKLTDNGKGNHVNGTNAALQKYWKNSNSVDNFTIYAYMPSSMFDVSTAYATREFLQEGGKIGASDADLAREPDAHYTQIGANKFLYVMNLLYKDKDGNISSEPYNGTVALNGEHANGTTIYFNAASTAIFSNNKFNTITGPASGEPLTLVFNGNLSLSGLAITGNVRILVNGTFVITGASSSATSNLMFLSNGNMTINQGFGNGGGYLFLSSYTNIIINGASFDGRMQTNGNITFTGNGITYSYSNAVLSAYSLPRGMQIGPS